MKMCDKYLGGGFCSNLGKTNQNAFNGVNSVLNKGMKVEFDSQPGCPTTSKSGENVKKVRTLVQND
jgi:hypothetical protein